MQREFEGENGYRLAASEVVADDDEFGDGPGPSMEITVTSAKGTKMFDLSKPGPLPKPYADGLRKQGHNLADFFWAGYVIRREARTFIDALWAELDAAHNAIENTLMAAESTIEGLAELRDAWADEERYRNEFTAMMADEYNDGARPPKARTTDVEDIARKYPRAAAYLKAESYRDGSGHWARAKAGGEAIKMLLEGATAEAANTHLESWLNDNCPNAIWN